MRISPLLPVFRPIPALLTIPYNLELESLDLAVWAACWMEDSLLVSRGIKSTEPVQDGVLLMREVILETAAWPFSGLRAVRYTWQLCSMANCLHTANPMPWFPPVTKMLLILEWTISG